MRRPFLLIAAVVGFGLASATALPALAVDSSVTFTITGTGMTISVPGAPTLGAVSTGATSTSGQIGPITVTDQRGVLNGAWTATVTSTDFTTGTASPAETIGNINVSYSSGPANTTGQGTFTAGDDGIINVPHTAFTGTALVGNNSATWNPTVTVAIPAAAVAGTYTATITHSVA